MRKCSVTSKDLAHKVSASKPIKGGRYTAPRSAVYTHPSPLSPHPTTPTRRARNGIAAHPFIHETAHSCANVLQNPRYPTSKVSKDKKVEGGWYDAPRRQTRTHVEEADGQESKAKQRDATLTPIRGLIDLLPRLTTCDTGLKGKGTAKSKIHSD